MKLCEGTITRAEEGDALIVTSALTVAEVVWKKGAPKLPEAKRDILRKFFRRSYIRVRNITRKDAELAQDLVWSDSVKPKDAIHIAAALNAGASAFETFDEDLIKKSGKIGSPGLIIRKPAAPKQGKLDV